MSSLLGPFDFKGYHDARVSLGVCGSIAAYKALDLLRLLLPTQAQVSATLTHAATHFVTPLAFQSLGASPVFSCMFQQGTDAFAHLYPGRQADAFIIAPATANTLAKLAHGLADDMLSSQALSFPKPLLIAPAMNPLLWESAATQENVATLLRRGHTIIEPETGAMACGDTGKGRLAEISTLFFHTLRALTKQDLAGKRMLVTVGPTREYWDGVRFLSNPSSGKMGANIAVAAWLRGAETYVVHGPLALELPSFLHRSPITTAQEMLESCASLWDTCDICCFCAAVCDFAPEHQGASKLKKTQLPAEQILRLQQTPDILKTFTSTKKSSQVAIGFAAETDSLAFHAQRKLREKTVDLLIGNLVNIAGSGFDSSTNRAFILDRQGRQEELPELSKSELAWRILDWLHLL